MPKDNTVMLQAPIDPMDHKIIKIMSIEKGVSMVELVRGAVEKLVQSKHGQAIADRIKQ